MSPTQMRRAGSTKNVNFQSWSNARSNACASYQTVGELGTTRHCSAPRRLIARSFEPRSTVPVPIPSDLAPPKIQPPFAKCFRPLRSAALSIFGRPSFTGHPIRTALQRARQIIAESGFTGLFEALKKGVALPAVAFVPLVQLFQQRGGGSRLGRGRWLVHR